MNAWSEILHMLAEDKSLRELVIAPNAQPMDQHAKGRKVLGSRTFSADDVAETLVSASTHVSGRRTGELGQSGVFCLGLREVGRLRISYFTQRGSRALRIVRVPFDTPTLDAVCVDPVQARELVQAIGAHRYKAVLIHGLSRSLNSLLVYALLDEMNKTHHHVIYVTERTLSFLLTHDGCVIIQVEIPTDVASMEAAIQNALSLEPDIVCLGDVRDADDLPSLPQMLSVTPCALLSAVSEDPSPLLNRIPPKLTQTLVEGHSGVVLRVLPAGDGRVKLDLQPITAPAA